MFNAFFFAVLFFFRTDVRPSLRSTIFFTDDEVNTFVWSQYLRATGCKAAPADLFKRVSTLLKVLNGPLSSSEVLLLLVYCRLVTVGGSKPEESEQYFSRWKQFVHIWRNCSQAIAYRANLKKPLSLQTLGFKHVNINGAPFNQFTNHV